MNATERMLREEEVTRLAIEVFKNEDIALEWMRCSNRALANAAAMDMMHSDAGELAVRQVLNAIAAGGPV